MMYFDLLAFLATHPILSFFILGAQFIIVMKIHHNMHNKYLHYALGAWFYPQDIVVNAVLFSIIGLELPRYQDKEWSVTRRLKRWKDVAAIVAPSALQKWRAMVATRLCDVLNRFHVGHC